MEGICAPIISQCLFWTDVDDPPIVRMGMQPICPPQKTNVCKCMQLAISKRRRTSFSESPRHLEVSVDELTLKNVVLHSVATAFASIVFPVPGGPTRQMPRHGRRMPLKNPGTSVG